MRKTKIICTLGPATDDNLILEELVKGGMDVARFNFSHGNHKIHKERLEKLIEIRERYNKHIAALMDTKGPEIRVKTFKNGKITVNPGQEFTFTIRDIEGDENIVAITYNELVNDLQPGNRILVDDGLIERKVIRVTDTDIVCMVINGGVISNNKGVNVPDVSLSMPY